MEVEHIIDVPVEHVYRILIDSAVYDIQQHSDEMVDRDQLTGISYHKTFNQHEAASITITQQEKGESYGFQTQTNKRQFDTLYHLEALDGKSRIRYVETVSSPKKWQSLNDRLMAKLTQSSKKKRLLQLFAAIEKDYQSQ